MGRHRRTPTKLRPLGDRVIVRADREMRAPERLTSGLLTAQTLASAVTGEDSRDSWFVGTIIALGPHVNRPCQRCGGGADPLTVGDRVVFSWAAGQEVTIDGERLIVLSAHEVLGLLSARMARQSKTTIQGLRTLYV